MEGLIKGTLSIGYYAFPVLCPQPSPSSTEKTWPFSEGWVVQRKEKRIPPSLDVSRSVR